MKLLLRENNMQNTRSFSWACELVKVCYHLGVREAVISPGSRNTSLTLALVYIPGIRCVSVIDERSAGFIALGMSKMTKRPTLLCCTSGTAGANYYPAIIEAYQSSIPLIVVTADRPAHLQQVGASQTIQQKYLFGSYVLDFIQLPEAGIQDRNALPTETHNEIIRLLKLASTGGPVHMNAPFNKPFEPTIEQLNKYIQDSKALVFGKEESPSNPIPNLASHRLVRPELIETTKLFTHNFTVAEKRLPLIDNQENLKRLAIKKRPLLYPDQVQNTYNQMHRPLIVIGSDPTPFQWFNLMPFLAKHPNARLILEAGASLYGWDFEESKMVQNKVIWGWEKLLFRSTQQDGSPFAWIDGIVRLGKEVVNPALAHFFSEQKHLPQLRFLSHESHEDASDSEPYFITPNTAFSWVDTHREHTQIASKEWHNSLSEFKAQYVKMLRAHFSQTKFETLTDGAVFYRLSTIIPTSIPIFLSNSFPVRDQALFAPNWSINNPLIAQRGAAGIDGISSTAFGVSLSTQLPTAVVTGDIAFLYDINALLSAKLITKPLVIFVINNGGGSIFSSLPVQQAVPDSMEWFLTPQEVSIEHLVKGYGLPYTRIDHSEQLWKTDWAEKIQHLLKVNILPKSRNDSLIQQVNREDLNKTTHFSTKPPFDTSKVHIVEFVTNSEASIAERNEFRR